MIILLGVVMLTNQGTLLSYGIWDTHAQTRAPWHLPSHDVFFSQRISLLWSCWIVGVFFDMTQGRQDTFSDWAKTLTLKYLFKWEFFSTLRDNYLHWMRPVNMWFFMTLAYRQGPWKSQITVGSLTVIRFFLLSLLEMILCGWQGVRTQVLANRL